MGMPATSQEYFTVEDVLSFPSDGNRYELAYGRLLVSPAPRLRHQEVVMRLARFLMEYCEHEGVGRVFAVPGDLTWGRNDVLTQPDVFVIGAADASVSQWSEVRHVPLVAEVLSPSSRSYDRFEKRLVYRDQHVDVYWLLDADAGIAEVWTPAAHFPVIERARLSWHPEGASSALVIDLATLFAE